MMGVAGILGGALLSAIHGATVINTIYQDGGAYTTFRAFSPTQPEETYSSHHYTAHFNNLSKLAICLTYYQQITHFTHFLEFHLHFNNLQPFSSYFIHKTSFSLL